MARWRLLGLILSAIGAVDSVYLLFESLYPSSVSLYCPSSGIFNCGLVTSSSYSKFAGIPVAFLGVAFFLAMLMLIWADDSNLNYLLLPLWAVGLIFVGYLVYAEVFVLHAICPYCTLAHIASLLLGFPATKMALGDEP